ncbi:MAG: ribonuclease III [Ignavibacteria bacterium]|nr:ribonuclease III [Ignavibacteria bacterium]
MVGAESCVFTALGKLFNWLLPRRSRSRLSLQIEGLTAGLEGKRFDFARFERIIGYHPKDWTLFFESLIHRSFLQYTDERWNSNERLEFLGDAILNSLVAEHLYRSYPLMEEGELTKIRSRLVNRRVLAQRAKDLQLPDFLLLSSSAIQSIGSGSESILSDAFEAIIGAIYVDGGLADAHAFVQRTLLANDDVLHSALTDDNHKSALLEYSQGRSLGVPRYMIVREDGPDHDRRFTVEVFLENVSYGTGTGRSKKDAEQAAAAQALDKIADHQSDTTQSQTHD